ncbi:MAG: hypothetical protein RLY31_115 [Bacteroidota bacterium]|jgi:23S rRNA (pseudouridine1915-N3)-methyltransferase
MAIFEKRLKHYLPFRVVLLPELRHAASLPREECKRKEAEMVLERLSQDDYLVLLDEKGEMLRSRELAVALERKLQRGKKRMVFLVGGAFGVTDQVRHRADFILSLSLLTFSHQMVRLFLLEQLYRSMTILRGESYHND